MIITISTLSTQQRNRCVLICVGGWRWQCEHALSAICSTGNQPNTIQVSCYDFPPSVSPVWTPVSNSVFFRQTCMYLYSVQSMQCIYCMPACVTVFAWSYACARVRCMHTLGSDNIHLLLMFSPCWKVYANWGLQVLPVVHVCIVSRRCVHFPDGNTTPWTFNRGGISR